MMIRTRYESLALLILLSFAISVGLPSGALVNAQRERRTDSTQKSPATEVRAQPSPTPIPTESPAASQLPVEQASPSAAVQPKTATPAKTVAELRNRISEILQKAELAPAMVSVKVTSLETGRVLFEENAAKLLRPASNMKIYTVAAALDRLSPDYRFTTSIYAPARPDASGVIRGDLTVYGRGDPSLAARFNNGDYFKGINDLASQIVAAGVKRVEGDLVGDESYFVGPKYGAGWEWEDLTWYYGAEITSLTVNDNALDLFVKPGPAVGQQASVITGPPDPLLTISNRVTTVPKGSRREISVYRGLAENTITITGSIPIDDRGYTGGIGISHPAKLFIYLLRTSLAQRGVTITGQSRTLEAQTSGRTYDPPNVYAQTSLTINSKGSLVEIATQQSPTFNLIASQTLKPSQNLYTELILRTLGKVMPPDATIGNNTQTSESLGLEAVKSFLRTAGIRPESLVLDDGSGLSRNDMITADASVQLLTFMSKHRYSNVFRDALPIAGVDGTLRNRMRGTPAENNVRAKTGSLSSAASLSGYVTTAAGERLAFAIMVNNYPSEVDPRTACIDPIAVLLASFTGKSQ
jgi:serine-type D-Ala-D-Ala carboxypeptidase/endopeptidase (penicillin-binding protein 4)